MYALVVEIEAVEDAILRFQFSQFQCARAWQAQLMATVQIASDPVENAYSYVPSWWTLLSFQHVHAVGNGLTECVSLPRASSQQHSIMQLAQPQPLHSSNTPGDDCR